MGIVVKEGMEIKQELKKKEYFKVCAFNSVHFWFCE
jgi:hypothetical protein